MGRLFYIKRQLPIINDVFIYNIRLKLYINGMLIYANYIYNLSSTTPFQDGQAVLIFAVLRVECLDCAHQLQEEHPRVYFP